MSKGTKVRTVRVDDALWEADQDLAKEGASWSLSCLLGFHYWGPLFLNRCNICGKISK